MKSLKKQLAAAVAMCLVAAIALSSATYAWFTNNTEAKATGMTVNAVADSSLVIKGSEDSAFSSVGTNALSETTLKPSTSYDGNIFAMLADRVQVKSAGSSAATWTGTSGAYETGDLIKVTGTGYYADTTYELKSIGEAANVYVKSITPSSTDTIHKAVKMSIKIGSTTYVYNVGGGTVTQVGTTADGGDTWSLTTPSYTSTNDTSKTFALTADTAATVYVKIWYEGQDQNCFTDNINTTDDTFDIVFAKYVPAAS